MTASPVETNWQKRFVNPFVEKLYKTVSTKWTEKDIKEMLSDMLEEDPETEEEIRTDMVGYILEKEDELKTKTKAQIYESYPLEFKRMRDGDWENEKGYRRVSYNRVYRLLHMQGVRMLAYAHDTDDFKNVIRLLKAGVDPRVSDGNGRYLLKEAVEKNSVAFKFLAGVYVARCYIDELFKENKNDPRPMPRQEEENYAAFILARRYSDADEIVLEKVAGLLNRLQNPIDVLTYCMKNPEEFSSENRQRTDTSGLQRDRE